MPRLMNIRYAMSRHPITVGPAISIEKAARLMKKYGVSSLVVEENCVIKGFVTQGDLVKKALLGRIDIKKKPVSEIMNNKVVVIHESADIMDAMKLMGKHDLRRLPVVNDKGELVGLVTIKDILAVQPELLNLIIEKGKLGTRQAL